MPRSYDFSFGILHGTVHLDFEKSHAFVVDLNGDVFRFIGVYVEFSRLNVDYSPSSVLLYAKESFFRVRIERVLENRIHFHSRLHVDVPLEHALLSLLLKTVDSENVGFDDAHSGGFEVGEFRIHFAADFREPVEVGGKAQFRLPIAISVKRLRGIVGFHESGGFAIVSTNSKNFSVTVDNLPHRFPVRRFSRKFRGGKSVVREIVHDFVFGSRRAVHETFSGRSLLVGDKEPAFRSVGIFPHSNRLALVRLRNEVVFFPPTEFPIGPLFDYFEFSVYGNDLPSFGQIVDRIILRFDKVFSRAVDHAELALRSSHDRAVFSKLGGMAEFERFSRRVFQIGSVGADVPHASAGNVVRSETAFEYEILADRCRKPAAKFRHFGFGGIHRVHGNVQDRADAGFRRCHDVFRAVERHVGSFGDFRHRGFNLRELRFQRAQSFVQSGIRGSGRGVSGSKGAEAHPHVGEPKRGFFGSNGRTVTGKRFTKVGNLVVKGIVNPSKSLEFVADLRHLFRKRIRKKLVQLFSALSVCRFAAVDRGVEPVEIRHRLRVTGFLFEPAASFEKFFSRFPYASGFRQGTEFRRFVTHSESLDNQLQLVSS